MQWAFIVFVTYLLPGKNYPDFPLRIIFSSTLNSYYVVLESIIFTLREPRRDLINQPVPHPRPIKVAEPKLGHFRQWKQAEHENQAVRLWILQLLPASYNGEREPKKENSTMQRTEPQLIKLRYRENHVWLTVRFCIKQYLKGFPTTELPIMLAQKF